MHQDLARIDPLYAAMIHVTDPIRIVRALEVFTLTGVAYSEHHRRHAAEGPRYRAHFVALDVARAALAPRIAARTHSMLERGLIHEVRALLDEGYSPDLKPLRSVGYAEVVAHCLGEVERSALDEAIAKSTRDYAKRQRTWFRGEQGVTWLVPDAHTLDEIVAATEALFAGE
jgi:tRNA dimethylallyltransferase